MTRVRDHLILSGTSGEHKDEPGASFDDGANWFEWLNSWMESKAPELERKMVQSVPEKTGRRPIPLAEHKHVRAVLEAGESFKMKEPPEVGKILESIKPIRPVYFERLDLPVTAFSVFEHDPEEYRRVYELGALPEEFLQNDMKLEEWNPDEVEETLGAADFGTLIHKMFEYFVLQPDKAAQKLPHFIHRYAANLDSKTREEINQLCVQFLKSKTFSEIKRAKARYPEIPFVFRLHGGIIQGTLDLLYQTADGKWVILDYKTSEVSESNLEEVSSRYQSQLLLYGLACHDLLKISVSRASLYFVKINREYDFSLESVDFTQLKTGFESLQKKMIDSRRAQK